MNEILRFASYFFALLTLCGLGYLGLSLYSALRHLKRKPAQHSNFTPPVSILKPLRGTDREIYESFRSHCLQDYSQYEIIFGVNDESDEAVAEVDRLRREFPDHDIRLMVCSEPTGTNRKVSNLLQMARAAKYDHLLINDSDIRVERDYLRKVLAPMSDPNVGMVTALYRAEGGSTLASRLEALSIGTDFVGGVLSAIQLEKGLHFAMGSTMAFPRKALDAIGGLAPILDYLADDYELGHRISKAGFRNELADTVVETYLPDYGFGGMFAHQLRWARTIRDRRKADYFGLLFTFALPWSIAALLCARFSAWSVVLLVLTALLRLVCAYVLCGPVLKDRKTMRDLWLVPLRDVVGLAIWLASHFGNTISWRGEVFRLKQGKLIRV